MRYGMEHYTKNRKLILEEYDDNGNLIDRRDMGEASLASFINHMLSSYRGLDIIRHKYLSLFSEEEWEEIYEFIRVSNMCAYYTKDKMELIDYIEDEHIDIFREYLSISDGEREFIIEAMNENCHGGRVKCALDSPKLPSDIESIRDYVANTDGIYYAMSSTGELAWRFNEKPTRKQAKYQRNKNGNKIVFRSLRDWQYYDISEDELM